ncbi:MAG: hypothetical protein ABJE10_22210 [bacterium]
MIGKRTQMTMALFGILLMGAQWRPLLAQSRQRDVITRDELMEAHGTVDLFQAIRGLRPQFLQPPPGARTRVVATSFYVDGIRQGGIESLKVIAVPQVERVEYLDPSRAESQFGRLASGGAVMVTLTGGRHLPASVRDTITQPPR